MVDAAAAEAQQLVTMSGMPGTPAPLSPGTLFKAEAAMNPAGVVLLCYPL